MSEAITSRLDAIDAMDAAIYRLKGFTAILDAVGDGQRCNQAFVKGPEFWFGIQELSVAMRKDLGEIEKAQKVLEAEGGAR